VSVLAATGPDRGRREEGDRLTRAVAFFELRKRANQARLTAAPPVAGPGQLRHASRVSVLVGARASDKPPRARYAIA